MRAVRNPPKFWQRPVRVQVIPHTRVRVGSQNRGDVSLRMTLHGTSNTIKPTKNAVSAARNWFPARFEL